MKTTKSTMFVWRSQKDKNKFSFDSIVGDNKIITQENLMKRKNLANIAKSKILIKPKNHDFSSYSKNMDTRLRFFTPKLELYLQNWDKYL